MTRTQLASSLRYPPIPSHPGRSSARVSSRRPSSCRRVRDVVFAPSAKQMSDSETAPPRRVSQPSISPTSAIPFTRRGLRHPQRLWDPPPTFPTLAAAATGPGLRFKRYVLPTPPLLFPSPPPSAMYSFSRVRPDAAERHQPPNRPAPFQVSRSSFGFDLPLQPREEQSPWSFSAADRREASPRDPRGVLGPVAGHDGEVRLGECGDSVLLLEQWVRPARSGWGAAGGRPKARSRARDEHGHRTAGTSFRFRS